MVEVFVWSHIKSDMYPPTGVVIFFLMSFKGWPK